MTHIFYYQQESRRAYGTTVSGCSHPSGLNPLES